MKGQCFPRPRGWVDFVCGWVRRWPMADTQQSVDVYHVEKYDFGTKTDESDASKTDPEKQLEEYKKAYEAEGMGRKARAVILTHLHGHPHLLLFKPKDRRDRDSRGPTFKLPGGALKTGESETEGLQRVLAQLLAPTVEQAKTSVEFEVVDLVSTWWRPDFDERLYPYQPVHVSFPKECTKVYLVAMSGTGALSVPESIELRAVPLYELYGNSDLYGPMLNAIPQLLSRYNLNCVDSGPEEQDK